MYLARVVVSNCGHRVHSAMHPAETEGAGVLRWLAAGLLAGGDLRELSVSSSCPYGLHSHGGGEEGFDKSDYWTEYEVLSDHG